MSQEIKNQGEVGTQVNIGVNSGPIYQKKPTRWSKRFEKLKAEVANDVRYDQFIENFITYNTARDGMSAEEKLRDGQFSEAEIFDAIVRKERYSKKLEKNKNYETAQKIDVEIFASIKLNFDTYVWPLIQANAGKVAIRRAVTESVVNPVLNLLNEEGGEDDVLNYTADDIVGMIYFLTGKCHLNWFDYDRLQPDV